MREPRSLVCILVDDNPSIADRKRRHVSFGFSIHAVEGRAEDVGLFDDERPHNDQPTTADPSRRSLTLPRSRNRNCAPHECARDARALFRRASGTDDRPARSVVGPDVNAVSRLDPDRRTGDRSRIGDDGLSSVVTPQRRSRARGALGPPVASSAS